MTRVSRIRSLVTLAAVALVSTSGGCCCYHSCEGPHWGGCGDGAALAFGAIAGAVIVDGLLHCGSHCH
jgi:hypothetical protein